MRCFTIVKCPLKSKSSFKKKIQCKSGMRQGSCKFCGKKTFNCNFESYYQIYFVDCARLKNNLFLYILMCSIQPGVFLYSMLVVYYMCILYYNVIQTPETHHSYIQVKLTIITFTCYFT